MGRKLGRLANNGNKSDYHVAEQVFGNDNTLSWNACL